MASVLARRRQRGERRGVALMEVHAAVEALDALPALNASATLNALPTRHGRRRRA
jgi:hypothetical protein